MDVYLKKCNLNYKVLNFIYIEVSNEWQPPNLTKLHSKTIMIITMK